MYKIVRKEKNNIYKIRFAGQMIISFLVKFETVWTTDPQAVTEIVHERIYSHVQDTCKGSFEVGY